ncbi:MAG TPA: hypothetical protein VFK21_09080 [Gammaproteobacteria bacterium]|nr:hypothetical protein [Gammaproteobacteria bacterium]
MTSTIFFSWQSDTSEREGKSFVEEALRKAIATIEQDTTLIEATRSIEIDMDTAGVPGSPPIVETIFKKIDKAAVFVADMSFVGKRLDGRPTPNPNVLIEYGWALKSRGHGRIIPVMNVAYGKPTPDGMPFDMRHLRNPICYNCPTHVSDEFYEKELLRLTEALKKHVHAILSSNELQKDLSAENQKQKYSPITPQGIGRFRADGSALGVRHTPGGGSGDSVNLIKAPAIWFRLMPVYSPAKEWLTTDLQKKVHEVSITPLFSSAGGYGFVRNTDGFGVYRVGSADKPRDTDSVVFVFKTGEIWAIDTYVMRAQSESGKRIIPPLEDEFASALTSYARYLGVLGIGPPYRWMAGAEDLKGRKIYRGATSGMKSHWPEGNCLQDIFNDEGVFVPSESPKESLRHFFSKLYDLCGLTA